MQPHILGFDCETTALDPLTGKLALIQLNHNGETTDLYEVLRDPGAMQRAQRALEHAPGLIVGHNLKFDLKWVCTAGIMPDPTKIFDTMIASQLLYAGITTADEATLRSTKISKAYDSDIEPLFDFASESYTFTTMGSGGRFSHSLQAVLMRELGVTIKKEMQTSDWAKPLSPEQVAYAKSDVVHLPALYTVLSAKLEKWGLTRVAEIEMQMVYVLAYIEMIGAKIDRKAWTDYARELTIERDALKQDLEYNLGMRGGGQVGLFGTVPDPINANSNAQLQKLFKLPNMQNETVQEQLKKDDVDPLLVQYASYKAVAKLASTYGDKYLSFAQYRDRLRGEFTQASTATGRLSSRSPNQQNVPPKIIKSNLRAEPGYEMFQADYSQVELKILANVSQDPNFLKTTLENDVHSANARLMFKIPEGEPVPKELRRRAKVLSFAIPYGVSAKGLFQRGIGASIQEAKQILEDFYTAFPGVRKYLEQQQENAITHGFTRDAIGRVRRYEVPTKPANYDALREFVRDMRAMAERVPLDNFQDLVFDAHKKNSPTAQTSMDLLLETFDASEIEKAWTVMRFDSKISSIRREAMNHGIQATSASITKLALTRLQAYLQETGYGYIVLTIHDSVFFELKTEFIRVSAPEVVRIMEQAGADILGGDATTPVDGDVGWMEKRPCACCGEKDYYFNKYFDEHYNVFDVDWNHIICEECAKLSPEAVLEKQAARTAALQA